MKLTITISTFLFLLISFANAQVGIGTETPEAILDIKSNNSGVLFPRMTSKEIKDNITEANEGMLVFNTDLGCLMVNTLSYANSGPDWRCLLYNFETPASEIPARSTNNTNQSVFAQEITNRIKARKRNK